MIVCSECYDALNAEAEIGYYACTDSDCYCTELRRRSTRCSRSTRRGGWFRRQAREWRPASHFAGALHQMRTPSHFPI